MDVTKTTWHRRWLPPLLVLATLVTLAAGVVIGLTARRVTSASSGG